MYIWDNELKYRVYRLYDGTYSDYVESQYEVYKLALHDINDYLRINNLIEVVNRWSDFVDTDYNKFIASSFKPNALYIATYDYFDKRTAENSKIINQLVVIVDNNNRIYPVCKLDCLYYNYRLNRYKVKEEYLKSDTNKHYGNWRISYYKINYPEFRDGPIPGVHVIHRRYGRKIQYKNTIVNTSIADIEEYREFNIKIRMKTRRNSLDIEPFEDREKNWKSQRKVKKQWMRNRGHAKDVVKLGKALSNELYDIQDFEYDMCG